MTIRSRPFCPHWYDASTASCCTHVRDTSDEQQRAQGDAGDECKERKDAEYDDGESRHGKWLCGLHDAFLGWLGWLGEAIDEVGSCVGGEDESAKGDAIEENERGCRSDDALQSGDRQWCLCRRLREPVRII